MKTVFAIVGAGGHGRETLPLARLELREEIAAGRAGLVFAVEGPTSSEPVNGCSLLSLEAFLALPGPKRFNVAICDSQARQRIAEACLRAGARPFSVTAPNALVLDGVRIGQGAILSPFVAITANVHIGDFFHANSYTLVSHDCVVGDYVTFGPGAKCCGRVHVADHAYIGAGALIREGTAGRPLTIGRGAVVGMGAVVTRDVPPGETVAGVPARPLARRGGRTR